MKKLLKLMASASVLAVVSMPASATVTNYTTVITGWLTFYGALQPSHPTEGAHFNGAGTASYDDTTHSLTYSYVVTHNMDHLFPVSAGRPAIATWTQSGTMNLATGTGINTASGCFDILMNYLSFCNAPNNADGVPIPWDYVTVNNASSPPSVNYGWESYPYGPDSGNITAMSMVFGPTTPPFFASVPVPAAAWLFGSAVLGLAGVGRRRCAGQESH